VSLYSVCFSQTSLYAHLLLFPLKSCDFRGPRQSPKDIVGEEEKQGNERIFYQTGKIKLSGLCFDDVQRRVTQGVALVQFVRSESFFPIPYKEEGVFTSLFFWKKDGKNL